MPRRLLALLGLLAACDDGWRAEEVVRLPPGLVEGATDPRRWAVAEAAERLLDRPELLYRQPFQAAHAAGLVEYLATAFQDGRYADGQQVTRLLREGRTQLRAAIGLRDDVLPQAASDALLAAAAAGRRDPARAAAALDPVRRPGVDPWARMEELEPPGQVVRALRAARDMIYAIDPQGGSPA